MAAPHIYRTDAIILRRRDLGEADRILTLYTPHIGKLSAIAKGVRRPTSKLGGHVELLACSRMQMARGRDLDIVTQSEMLHAFPRLREDLYRTTYGFHVAELLDSLIAERIEQQPVYDLLLLTLQRLDTEEDPELAVRFFEVQLLGLLGYRPELRRCLRCQQEIQPIPNYFSAPSGGILCQDCGRTSVSGVEISVNALKVLRLLQSGQYDLARRLRLDRGLRSEVEATMRNYLQFVLERRLRSADMLAAIRQG